MLFLFCLSTSDTLISVSPWRRTKQIMVFEELRFLNVLISIFSTKEEDGRKKLYTF